MDDLVGFLQDRPIPEIRQVAPPRIERLADASRASCPDCSYYVIVHDKGAFFIQDWPMLPHICVIDGRYWQRVDTQAVEIVAV